jgi:GNAT superfamily N-acetyltransferase
MTLLHALARAQVVQARPIDPGDHDFLQALYASVREPELAPSGWAPAERQAFLAQQFECQHRYYHEHFPDAEFLLLLRSGCRIGRLYWHADLAGAALMDLSLVPAWRGCGLGTAIMQLAIEHADRHGLAIGLHVEPANPARRLYRRFGFDVAADNGVYLKMCRDTVYAASATAHGRCMSAPGRPKPQPVRAKVHQ